MDQINANHAQLQQGLFRPLQQDAFQRLQHSASLKGLLKPFKGKGELAQFAQQCREMEVGLQVLAQGVLEQTKRPPYNLMPVRLMEQRTPTGTIFLRWQNVVNRKMGVGTWAQMVTMPRTPESMLHDFYTLELQRISLNMQMSLMHSMVRQALECAQKMSHAEAVYSARLQQPAPPIKNQQSESLS